MEKARLEFTQITDRLKQLALPDVDMVVGIGTGGAVPASLVAYQLHRPLMMLHVNYRAEDNRPQRSQPELLGAAEVPPGVSSLLLVDDVSVSGRTLAFARQLLSGYTVHTLVFKGDADYVLFPTLDTCVDWPWKRGLAPTVSTPGAAAPNH